MGQSIFVRFVRPLPMRVLLKGEWWSIDIGYTRAKSRRYANVYASRKGAGDGYVLTEGMSGDVIDAARDGFWVTKGTPQHGLVSAMHRVGVAELFTTAQPTKLQRMLTFLAEQRAAIPPPPPPPPSSPRPRFVDPNAGGIRFTTSDLYPDETSL